MHTGDETKLMLVAFSSGEIVELGGDRDMLWHNTVGREQRLPTKAFSADVLVDRPPIEVLLGIHRLLLLAGRLFLAGLDSIPQLQVGRSPLSAFRSGKDRCAPAILLGNFHVPKTCKRILPCTLFGLRCEARTQLFFYPHGRRRTTW